MCSWNPYIDIAKRNNCRICTLFGILAYVIFLIEHQDSAKKVHGNVECSEVEET